MFTMDMRGKTINKTNKIQREKSKLLSVAARLIRRHSYEVVTIRNICREADISIGGFYRYFAGKDDLLTSYVSECFTLYLKKKQGAAGLSNPRNEIINTMVYFADYFQSMGLEFVSNYFSPKNQSLNMISVQNMESQRQVVDYFLTQFQALREQGMIGKNCDVQELFEELNVIIDGSVFHWCLKKGAYDLPAVVKKMCTSYLNLYLEPGYTFKDAPL
jgi:AcrR family transcriptional regulator